MKPVQQETQYEMFPRYDYVMYNDHAALVAMARAAQAREMARLLGLAFRPVKAIVKMLFWNPVVRTFERAALTRELMELDDRALHDMGITRSQIPGIVDRSYPAEDGLVAFLRDKVWLPMDEARRRAALRDEMESLDDRKLADMGIRRDDIPLLVQRAVHTDATTPAPANDPTAPHGQAHAA